MGSAPGARRAWLSSLVLVSAGLCKRSTTRGPGTYPYRGEGMQGWVVPLRGHENLESGA